MSTPPMSGPFGPGGRGAIDLGRVAQASAQREQITQALAEGDLGAMPWPLALMTLGNALLEEVHGIRRALSPLPHVPAVAAVTNADGKLVGYGTFCLACSEEMPGEQYATRCRLLDENSPMALDWPPQFLVQGDIASLNSQRSDG